MTRRLSHRTACLPGGVEYSSSSPAPCACPTGWPRSSVSVRAGWKFSRARTPRPRRKCCDGLGGRGPGTRSTWVSSCTIYVSLCFVCLWVSRASSVAESWGRGGTGGVFGVRGVRERRLPVLVGGTGTLTSERVTRWGDAGAGGFPCVLGSWGRLTDTPSRAAGAVRFCSRVDMRLAADAGSGSVAGAGIGFMGGRRRLCDSIFSGLSQTRTAGA